MKEAGYVAEILQIYSLNAGKNVLVDGSLRDYEWYRQGKIYKLSPFTRLFSQIFLISIDFEQKRKIYPKIRLAIIHVVAPRETVFERAEARAKITGRVVPKELIAKSLQQCSTSVTILKNHVDYFAEIKNAPDTHDVELVIPEYSAWDEFAMNWEQTLESIPGRVLRRFSSLSIVDRKKLLTSGHTRDSVFNLSNHLEKGIIPKGRHAEKKTLIEFNL